MKKTVWISLLSVCCLFSIQRYVHAAELVVDVSETRGAFKNIAGGINFWGLAEAQERFINEVGTDLYRLKVRLHRVERVGDGYRNFPWEGDDLTLDDIKGIVRNIQAAKKRGCQIMLQIYGMPAWLSLSKDPTVVTNGLPNYAKYPPRDHDEWAKLVSATIVRLGSLGLDDIDYYEVFGEPNVGSTWYGWKMPCRKEGNEGGLVHACKPNDLGHNTVRVLEEFFKVYESTVKGIRHVDADAKIGGIAVTPNPSGIWWTRFFAEYVRSHQLPLVFYSWHSYGTDESLSSILAQLGSKKVTLDLVRRFFYDRLRNRGFRELEINRIILDLHAYLAELKAQGRRAVRRPYGFMSSALKKILSQEGLGSTELFLTEWNVSHALDPRHDTHYGASFLTRGLIDITDSNTVAQTLYVLSARSLSDHERRFWGFYGLFGSNKTLDPKASFNAFKLFSMLEDNCKRLDITTTEEDIYAIATDNGDNVSVMLTYYRMDKEPDYRGSKEIWVRLKNVPFSRYKYIIYVIDKNHANSYYGTDGELIPVERGTGEARFDKKLTLPIYGVSLVRLEKDSQNR